MHILNTNSHLTNIEVLRHINNAKATTRSENLQTIVVELQAYLRERPAGNSYAPQDEAKVKKFKQEVAKFALEPAEVFQMVNTAPNSLPTLFCIVDEADIRFSEEQLDELLALSGKYLGSEPIPGED